MNAQSELSADQFKECPGPDAPDSSTKGRTEIAEEMPSAAYSKMAPQYRRLFDSFYYWVMSRS